MKREEFWRHIDECIGSRNDPEDFEDCLGERLDALEDDELVAFDREFRAVRNEAYDWGLWGAAYVIGGGCSDDSFEYFRTWLVCQGQETYDGAMADPDALAEIFAELEEPEDVWFGYETIAYLAAELWEQRHPGDEFPRAPVPMPDEPSGEAWDEDEPGQLRNLYPRLWDHFGGDELDEFEDSDD